MLHIYIYIKLCSILCVVIFCFAFVYFRCARFESESQNSWHVWLNTFLLRCCVLFLLFFCSFLSNSNWTIIFNFELIDAIAFTMLLCCCCSYSLSISLSLSCALIAIRLNVIIFRLVTMSQCYSICVCYTVKRLHTQFVYVPSETKQSIKFKRWMKFKPTETNIKYALQFNYVEKLVSSMAIHLYLVSLGWANEQANEWTRRP